MGERSARRQRKQRTSYYPRQFQRPRRHQEEEDGRLHDQRATQAEEDHRHHQEAQATHRRRGLHANLGHHSLQYQRHHNNKGW